jgi:DNA polymerase-4
MIVCIRLDDYLLCCNLNQWSLPTDVSLILLHDDVDGKSRVLQCNNNARDWGIIDGMLESRARVVCPGAVFVSHDEEKVVKHQVIVEQLLQSLSPKVDGDTPGLWYVDSGKWRGNSTEVFELTRIRCRFFEQFGLHVTVGSGGTRFTAKMAALACEKGGALVVPPGDEASFLEPMPVSFLPVTNKTKERLEKLGLNRFGDVSRLSRAQLNKQFIEDGELLFNLCKGVDWSPVRSEKSLESFSSKISFEYQIMDVSSFYSALEPEFEKLFSKLLKSHLLCCGIRLEITLEDKTSQSLQISCSLPIQEFKQVKRLLMNRLYSNQFVKSPVFCDLKLTGIVEEQSRQKSLFGLFRHEFKKNRLKVVAKKLHKKGLSLLKVVWDEPDSRLPEQKAHLEDQIESSNRLKLYEPCYVEISADERGLPRFVRTNNGWKQVDAVIKQWKVDWNWWSDDPVSRSYFQLLLQDGSFLQIFYNCITNNWYRQSGH